MRFAARTGWNLQSNLFARTLEAAKKSGTSLLDLTTSNPTEAGLHYDNAAILKSFQNRAALTYTPDPKGLRSAREAVQGYYRELATPAAVDCESIILTTSTSEAYTFAFRLLCD